MKLSTKIKHNFPVLMKLRTDNENEFRHQIVARLNRISSEKNKGDFIEILTHFKKEFINDSFFYIDVLNKTLKNILLTGKENYLDLYKEFVFLAQIGDVTTLELLKKALPDFMGNQKVYTILGKEIDDLDNRVDQLEERANDFKLFPMKEILDKWVE